MTPKKNTPQNEGILLEKPIFPVIYKYGSIGGTIIVLIGMLQTQVLGHNNSEGETFSTFLPMALILISDIVYILLMILAIKAYKKYNDGVASFGKAFLVTFLTGLFIAFVSWIFTILLSYIIGVPDITMGVETNNISEENVYYSFIRILAGSLPSLFLNCVFGGIMALIISLVTKNNRPIDFIAK
jgi:ABC-type multidrug transport system permease subunit